MDKLKKQAEELGIKVDGRWSEDRLREEIETAQAAKAAADEQAAAEAEAERQAQEAQRAAEDEAARLAAEAQAEAEAQALAQQEAEAAAQAAAEEQARLDAEAEANRAAQDEALEREIAEGSVVLVNLQANPVRNLGLEGYGEATILPHQLDAITIKRIQRGVDLGLLKVKE